MNDVLMCIPRALILRYRTTKRYSSLEFCIWHVLLYSVIIEVYIYVTVLAGLNTSYNNNIIVKHFRGLVLGLAQRAVTTRSEIRWNMVNWASPQNRGFGEMDLYRWICTAGFVQLDVQMLYSIKYCVQAGIGWYRLDLPSVGPRGEPRGLFYCFYFTKWCTYRKINEKHGIVQQ